MFCQYHGKTMTTILKGQGWSHKGVLHVSNLRISMNHRTLKCSDTVSSIRLPPSLKLDQMLWDSHVGSMGSEETSSRALRTVLIPNADIRIYQTSSVLNDCQLIEDIVSIVGSLSA
mmetsp:Transcript_44866/g.94125  ORF Transcript_44866/g.94125 Transcript_44866/m.94125 type:complete len:116 (-) Transcript_44866:200-547(-)